MKNKINPPPPPPPERKTPLGVIQYLARQKIEANKEVIKCCITSMVRESLI